MSWVAVVGGAVALGGAALQNRAGRDAAQAQQQGLDAATAENRRQFDITQQNLQPWLDAGSNALGQQQAFLAGDWSGFQQSPDYLWAVNQGTQALDRGAAAGGNLWGGGADADRIALGQGLATQYAGNYYNRLAGLSGTGQQTAGQLGQFGQQFGQTAGQNAIAGGQAQASAYANRANAWGNALQGLGGAFGQWAGNRNPGSG